MPSQHKTPVLGWHPPAELLAWIKAEARRRSVTLSLILTEALSEYRTAHPSPPHDHSTDPKDSQ